MKKWIFLTICIFQFYNFSNGQTYKSVLDNTTFVQYTNTMVWVDKKSKASNSDDPYYMGTQFSLDSICFQNYKEINGQLYAKYKSVYNKEYPHELCWLVDEEVYLREDDNGTKLYSVNNRDITNNPNSEFLIYDISLQKEDVFPTVIYEYFDEGVGHTISEVDTNLVVDTVYYEEGRKVIQFNYYQKFGPYSQYYKFIEGIGPNYGIFPMWYKSDGDYLWSCLLGVYQKEYKQYNFYKGVLPFSNIEDYYSIAKNTSWGHYIVKGDVLPNQSVDDPYYSTMEQGYDSLLLVDVEKVYDFDKIKLYSAFSNDTVYLTQVSNSSKIYSNINDTALSASNLIYDISLQKGDTFDIKLYLKNQLNEWKWTDTTLIVDRVYYDEGRKVVEFDYWLQLGSFSHYLKFIEGLGSTFGLYPGSDNTDISFSVLTSAYNNWLKVYGYTPYISSLQQNNQQINIQVYPNPTSGLIYLNGLKNKEIVNVSIFNLNGQRVFSKDITNSQEIDISKLSKGIYMLALINKNQIYYSVKIKKD